MIYDIKYKDVIGNDLTIQQLKNCKEYLKVFYIQEKEHKEEVYYRGDLMGVNHYNHENKEHQDIIKSYQLNKEQWINIVEYELFLDYKLERKYHYRIEGNLTGIDLALIAPNNDIIGHGYKEADGKYDYSQTKKYYWDRAINTERELFDCTYREDTGTLLELYWNNFHIDEDGQESFALLNTEEDIQQLRTLTGMTEALATYYMHADIVPAFDSE